MRSDSINRLRWNRDMPVKTKVDMDGSSRSPGQWSTDSENKPTCSLPRSILFISWSPLWRSSSRSNSSWAILSCRAERLHPCSQRGLLSKSVFLLLIIIINWGFKGLWRGLSLTSIRTSKSLTCRSFSSLTRAFLLASISWSWSFFSRVVSLSTASSRFLWHCSRSSSRTDS